MSGYCTFLAEYNPELYKLANNVDELVFVDAGSAVVKARNYVELLVSILVDEYKIGDYGLNLKQKIDKLYRKSAFKNEVFERMDAVRTVGNKGAHESFSVTIHNALTIHRYIYQLSKWYVVKHLGSSIEVEEYKEPTPKSSIDEEKIQEYLQKYLREFTPKHLIDEEENEDKEELEEGIEFEELPEGESYLLRELSRLKSSSKEALENPGQFNNFKRYLHVRRDIQEALEEKLKREKNSKRSLILLVGSVGDGKSHLLANLLEETDLLDGYEIVNDATESMDPLKTSLETLELKLEAFSDHANEDKKIILAINLGVLNNFINSSIAKNKFTGLIKYVENSGVLTNETRLKHEESMISSFNFAAHQPFTLQNGDLKPDYFNALLDKITAEHNQNPFYKAYKLDIERNVNTVVHLNYNLLTQPNIKKQVGKLLSYIIIIDKSVISTRTLLNFIAEILIPEMEIEDDPRLQYLNDSQKLKYSLINILFENPSKSALLKSISKMDPINNRSAKFDDIIARLNNRAGYMSLVEESVSSKEEMNIFKPFDSDFNYSIVANDDHDNDLSSVTIQLLARTLIRSQFLNSKSSTNQEKVMQNYLEFLYGYNRSNMQVVKNLYKFIEEVMYKWRGTPDKGYIYINKMNDKYRIAQKLYVLPSFQQNKVVLDEDLKSFESSIRIGFQSNLEDDQTTLTLEIDYTLFELLSEVNKGYRPTVRDAENGLSFVHLINMLCRTSDEKSEFILHHYRDDKLYKLATSSFGDIVFNQI